MAAKRKDDGDEKRRKRRPPGFWQGARANFLTGLVVVVPIVLTVYFTLAFITFVDKQVLPLVPAPPPRAKRTTHRPEYLFRHFA